MTCPREERWAVYVDGETTGEEASALQAHLRTCSRCGSVVEALSAESRLLAGVLEEAVLPGEAVARAGWRDLGTAALGIAAAVAGLDALAGWVSGLLQEGPLRVLDPQAAAVSLLFEVFFYLLREGASMLASIQTVIAVVAVLLAGAFLTLLWRRRMPLGPFLLLAGSLVSAGSATALERRVARDDSESIVVRAGETVDDSLLAAGETVSVDGVVTGNLVACARRVTVRGSVQGDLIVAAQEVDLDGTVEGNVMGFAQELKQRGRVERSLHAFVQRVDLERAASVEHDLLAVTAVADLDGRVGRDLLAAAKFTNVRGEVGRHVTAWTERLHLGSAATVGGDVTAHVHNARDLRVEAGATVRGKTETRVREAKPGRSRYARPSFYLWKAIWLAAAFVTGLLLRLLVPAVFEQAPPNASDILKSLGLGFLVLVAGPVAIVAVGLTLVGLPVALAALGLWLAGLYASSIIVAALVGRRLLEKPTAAAPSFAPALLVGLLTLTVASSLPFLVGALVRSLVLTAGLGLLARRLSGAVRTASG